MKWQPELSIPYWIEFTTFQLWKERGVIVVTEEGEENVYAVTEFGQLVFAKYC